MPSRKLSYQHGIGGHHCAGIIHVRIGLLLWGEGANAHHMLQYLIGIGIVDRRIAVHISEQGVGNRQEGNMFYQERNSNKVPLSAKGSTPLNN